jgi:hypothetical protein
MDLFSATGGLQRIQSPQQAGAPGGPDADDVLRELRREASRIESMEQEARKAFADSRFDETSFDRDQLLAEPSDTVRGARKGREEEFARSQQAMQELALRRAQLDQAIQERMGGLLGEPARVDPGVVEQLAQQPPPAPPPGERGGLPVVNTIEEHAALPSGTQYIDSQDGLTYTKQ